MLSHARTRSPRSLVALIAIAMLVPLGMLLWLGWRLFDQDRLLEEQQVRQRVELAADLIVVALQRRLSTAALELGSGNPVAGEGAVVFAFGPPLREAPEAVFATGESLELRQNNFGAAIDAYRRLADSSDHAIRTGALMRLGRALRKSGRVVDAHHTYARLAEIDDVAVAGVPAAIVAMYARGVLLDEQGRADELKLLGLALERELESGRWPLTAAVYALYMRDAARWSGRRNASLEAAIFEQALGELHGRWTATQSAARASSTAETIEIQTRTLTVLWHNTEGRIRVLVATPAFVRRAWLADVEPLAKTQSVWIGIDGFDTSSGSPGARQAASHEVRRQRRESALPWALTISSIDPPPERSAFALRRYLLAAGFVLLVSMALVAGYLIVRAVNRELEAARVQADFVAAVSHEFRTPLTALRQFTDMLREQPNLGADRRELAYDAQSRATDRLTRLVESLLDFGRMEAGARRYHFEPFDCAPLVTRVIGDYAGEAGAAGHQIAFRSSGSVVIDGDEEAISTAVRNLIDNAAKYSPQPQTIEVALERRNGHVHIAVRDHGLGIPPSEHSRIFMKFHRGDEARIHGIKGTGIGLAMVREIVAAHRGRVELTSAPGTGSTFTIVLPAKEEPWRAS